MNLADDDVVVLEIDQTQKTIEFNCCKCSYSNGQSKVFRRHLRDEHVDYAYECAVCKSVRGPGALPFENVSLVAEHFELVHPGRNVQVRSTRTVGEVEAAVDALMEECHRSKVQNTLSQLNLNIIWEDDGVRVEGSSTSSLQDGQKGNEVVELIDDEEVSIEEVVDFEQRLCSMEQDGVPNTNVTCSDLKNSQPKSRRKPKTLRERILASYKKRKKRNSSHKNSKPTFRRKPQCVSAMDHPKQALCKPCRIMLVRLSPAEICMHTRKNKKKTPKRTGIPRVIHSVKVLEWSCPRCTSLRTTLEHAQAHVLAFHRGSPFVPVKLREFEKDLWLPENFVFHKSKDVNRT